jgi:acyl carrier protein
MATYDECVAQIQSLLSESVAKGEVVQADVDLIEELGLASLDVMEIIEQLEDIYDISFPINELAIRVQQLT